MYVTLNKIHVAYDQVYLRWKLGDYGEEHPTNPIRAKYAVEFLSQEHDIEIVSPDISAYDREYLELIHSKEYVSKVLDYGHCGEWRPDNLELGNVALHMFSGTVRLVEKMLANEARVCFNPQGAKHHAMYDHSSGFCVFNDMAWAAKEFHKNGMKVVYIDWDAHHGDGVEALLSDEPDIVTCSIHDANIFPGTGLDGHHPQDGIYNWAIGNRGGDEEFMKAIDEVEEVVHAVQPDVILLAAGADGHVTDPLSTIQFDLPGYDYAARAVGRLARSYTEGRVLIGGAGGYQPYHHTPVIWSRVVSNVHTYSNLWVKS